MKIKFYNLGSIQQTELDLRPLTVIIGPNNSNKTYIAYCVYGILQQCSLSVDNTIEDMTAFMAWYQEVSESVRQEIERHAFEQFIVQSKTNALCLKKPQPHIENAFIETLTTVFNQNIERFKNNLSIFFQDQHNQLFAKTHFSLLQTSFNTLFDNDIPLFGQAGKPIEEQITESIIDRIINTLLPKPFLLPAERQALIINYKILNHRRFKLLEQARRHSFNHDTTKKQFEMLREAGDIRYPQPIEDLLGFLADIDVQRHIKIESANKNVFQKLADKIETAIQNNNKTVLKSNLLGGKEIRVNVKRGLSIDLYNASSSIKQLAPLLLYLRYRAKKNDVLILDEPEMNLHPESQAKLLEIFGILVNLGVKVFITTHSPYFMDHLNSLVSGKTEHSETLKKQANALYLKDSRAFMTLEQVSAYEMRDYQLHSLKDEDGDIRCDTLSYVSHELQQRYFQIYETGKST